MAVALTTAVALALAAGAAALGHQRDTARYLFTASWAWLALATLGGIAGSTT